VVQEELKGEKRGGGRSGEGDDLLTFVDLSFEAIDDGDSLERALPSRSRYLLACISKKARRRVNFVIAGGKKARSSSGTTSSSEPSLRPVPTIFPPSEEIIFSHQSLSEQDRSLECLPLQRDSQARSFFPLPPLPRIKGRSQGERRALTHLVLPLSLSAFKEKQQVGSRLTNTKRKLARKSRKGVS